MAAVEELLFERLCKVDPTIPEALQKHRHRLDIGGYGRFKYVLKTEDSKDHHEWRKAIFCVLDAKLLELEVNFDGQSIGYYQKQDVEMFPVCTPLPYN